MADEKGTADESGNTSREHSDIWLDFVEGMGARRDMTGHTPMRRNPWADVLFPPDLEPRNSSRGPGRVLRPTNRKFHMWPRKRPAGLRAMYGADKKTTGYFTLHATADVFHANVCVSSWKSSWRQTRK
jgi:hypothetical protein